MRLAAIGRPQDSLGRINGVLEIPDHKERRRTIAADFARLSAADRARTIIVSGTNVGRREINSAVRRSLDSPGRGSSTPPLYAATPLRPNAPSPRTTTLATSSRRSTTTRTSA